MFLAGQEPQDLALKPAFVSDAMRHLKELAAGTASGPALAIGLPWAEAGGLFNAYAVLADGRIAGIARTYHLSVGAFDENRVYRAGPISGPFGIGPVRVGTPIGEDAWHQDVAGAMAESGADILLAPGASPYLRGGYDVRMNHTVARAVETGLPIACLNAFGGQDGQVFDGGSFGLNRGGGLAVHLPAFKETKAHVAFERQPEGWRAFPGERHPYGEAPDCDYRAMVLGLSDYVRKSGFSRVVLGLSGGIDSALVATIAVDALGPDSVRCVMLPSEFTSPESLEDAGEVAGALGCRLDTAPIEPARAVVSDALAPFFAGLPDDVTEENIQARLRMVMLMAIANKFGEMLLTTGSKSDIAVGNVTIYGAMAGGYGPTPSRPGACRRRRLRWRGMCRCPTWCGPVRRR